MQVSIPTVTMRISFPYGSIVAAVLLNSETTNENEYLEIWVEAGIYQISIICTYYAQNFGNEGDAYIICKNHYNIGIDNYIANVYYI